MSDPIAYYYEMGICREGNRTPFRWEPHVHFTDPLKNKDLKNVKLQNIKKLYELPEVAK
jgi:hypothetical protein